MYYDEYDIIISITIFIAKKKIVKIQFRLFDFSFNIQLFILKQELSIKHLKTFYI